MKEIAELPEALRSSFLVAIATACEAGPASADDADMLHRALTILADLLPKIAHHSYLELKTSPDAVESDFARLWRALIGLSPNPTAYVLRPRYR